MHGKQRKTFTLACMGLRERKPTFLRPGTVVPPSSRALWKLRQSQLRRARVSCWKHQRGRREVEDRGGYFVYALESSNSLLASCGECWNGSKEGVLCSWCMGSSVNSSFGRRIAGGCKWCQSLLIVWEARGMSGVWQRRVRWPVEPQWWLTRAVEGCEGGESGIWAEIEMMGSKGSNSSLEGSG